MSQLVENFLEQHNINHNFESSVLSIDKLEDEFNSYVFKAYLYGYIKKTITLSAIQLKKKNSQISTKEILNLNVIESDFNEERINLIADNGDDLSDTIIDQFIIKDSTCYNYNEICYDYEVLKAINTLTKRQKEIIYMCVILGETDTFVAKKLDITKQGVNKIKLTALNKLRRKLCI